MYGEHCLFRHEHRSFAQLHRHYYTSQLYALESLYTCSKDADEFIEDYEPATTRLPLFCAITAESAQLAESESEKSSEHPPESFYVFCGAETATDEQSKKLGDYSSSSTVSSGASSCLNTTQDDDSNSSSDEKLGRSDLNGNSSETDFENVLVRWLGLNFVNN